MGMSTRYEHHKERPWRIHPIWRGIGCLWLLLAPIMAFAGAKFIMANNRIVSLPRETYNVVSIPFINNPLTGGGYDLNFLINWLPEPPLRVGDVAFFLLFWFLSFGVLSLVYSFLYRFFGPPPNPYDQLRNDPRPRPRQRR